jgi:hypothetical protein
MHSLDACDLSLKVMLSARVCAERRRQRDSDDEEADAAPSEDQDEKKAHEPTQRSSLERPPITPTESDHSTHSTHSETQGLRQRKKTVTWHSAHNPLFKYE